MKMYIVSYSKYEYNDEQIFHIFVTDNENKASEYVDKFNRILNKWSKYYSQFVPNYYSKERYLSKYFYRWSTLKDFNEAYYDEVELR